MNKIVTLVFLLCWAFGAMSQSISHLSATRFVELYFKDEVSGQSLQHCEIRIQVETPTGEFQYGETGVAIDDYFQTLEYDVGSELTIIVRRPGYQLKRINHIIRPTGSKNIIQVPISAISRNADTITIEGFLTYREAGRNQPIEMESIRCKNCKGIKRTFTEHDGYYLLRIPRDLLENNLEIEIELGAPHGRSYISRTIWLPIDQSYYYRDFELFRSQRSVIYEIRVQDSLNGKPIENALVRIFQDDLLISEGSTGPDGKLLQKIMVTPESSHLTYYVFRECYDEFYELLPPTQQIIRANLIRTNIQVQGTIHNNANGLPVKIALYLDDSLFTTITLTNADTYTLTVNRKAVDRSKKLEIVASKGNRCGRLNIDSAEIVVNNAYQAHLINVVDESLARGSSFIGSIGITTEPDLKCYAVDVGMIWGPRLLKGLMAGARWGIHRPFMDNSYEVFDSSVVPMPNPYFLFPISIQLRYEASPQLHPWLHAFGGICISRNAQDFKAGIGFRTSEVTRLEVFVGLNRWTFPNEKVTFTHWGPAKIESNDRYHLTKFTFGINLNYLRLW
jgi:hypothetical protein